MSATLNAFKEAYPMLFFAFLALNVIAKVVCSSPFQSAVVYETALTKAKADNPHKGNPANT